MPWANPEHSTAAWFKVTSFQCTCDLAHPQTAPPNSVAFSGTALARHVAEDSFREFDIATYTQLTIQKRQNRRLAARNYRIERIELHHQIDVRPRFTRGRV